MNDFDPSEVEIRETEVPRWIEVPIGIFLGLIMLLCLAGAAALIFSLRDKAPVAAPVLGIVLVFPSLWALDKCLRLITGRKTKGGLMGSRALRIFGWFFLLLPLGGIFTGYYRTHTSIAIVQTVAYIGAFAGLQRLAAGRERDAEHNNAVQPTVGRSVANGG